MKSMTELAGGELCLPQRPHNQVLALLLISRAYGVFSALIYMSYLADDRSRRSTLVPVRLVPCRRNQQQHTGVQYVSSIALHSIVPDTIS